MSRVLLDEIVFTDYGQFDLRWSGSLGFDGDVSRFFAGQLNGLVGAADPSGIYLHFARRSGGSKLRIVRHDHAPPLEGAWEDVVEVSTVIPTSTIGWSTWAGERTGTVEGIAPGSYRIRLSGRGRDAGSADEFAPQPIDHYLLELWHAPLAPDAVLRTTSEDAAYWHREWGSKRGTD